MILFDKYTHLYCLYDALYQSLLKTEMNENPVFYKSFKRNDRFQFYRKSHLNQTFTLKRVQ